MSNTWIQPEILTVPEVAAMLRVVEKTVYTMVQGGEIPAFKVRGQWRFIRTDLAQWIESKKYGTVRGLHGGSQDE